MRAIYVNLTDCVLVSRSVTKVSGAVVAKRPVSLSSWPSNIATTSRAPRQTSAEGAAPTTSSSAVARDATVAKELHPQT